MQHLDDDDDDDDEGKSTIFTKDIPSLGVLMVAVVNCDFLFLCSMLRVTL